jgi:hypothetical protein
MAKLVETGAAPPTAAVLKRKQAALLKKLQSVTPDQLEKYRASSLESTADSQKISWQKTIWAK